MRIFENIFRYEKCRKTCKYRLYRHIRTSKEIIKKYSLIYYYIYIMGRTDLVALLSIVMAIAQILSQFFLPWLIGRLNKKHCLCIANIGMALGCSFIYGAELRTERL